MQMQMHKNETITVHNLTCSAECLLTLGFNLAQIVYNNLRTRMNEQNKCCDDEFSMYIVNWGVKRKEAVKFLPFVIKIIRCIGAPRNEETMNVVVGRREEARTWSNSVFHFPIMPLTHIPKYPVVHPQPGYDLVLSNIRFTDVLTIAAFTGFSFAVNWFGCKWAKSKVDPFSFFLILNDVSVYSKEVVEICQLEIHGMYWIFGWHHVCWPKHITKIDGSVPQCSWSCKAWCIHSSRTRWVCQGWHCLRRFDRTCAKGEKDRIG